ncbi:hypothetical protein MSG28_009377, partial [Choristoneura fumiferana]
MGESINDTLDLSRRGLKKIEKAPEDTKLIINLIFDQNELQRLDNIDTYSRVENIEGLKDLIYLKVLKLAGNNIKSVEHLNHNMHLEHLDLSNNQIAFIADISYLKSLKHLNLERNRITDLRQCDRYLPPSLEHLGLAHNNIQDLNEVSHLVHLSKLDSFTVQGNPCVAMAGKDKLLKAEWLYSQGKGRHYHSGQHQELCEYLASTCPLTADALDTEDQRKLRLILSKFAFTPDVPLILGDPPPKPVNQSLEAASKMVPVPESLMSPDYQDPMYDIQRTIPKPTNNSIHTISNTSSSNSSIHEDKPHRQITQPKTINNNMKSSPKLPKSATSSPKMKSKAEQQRKGSLKLESKVNGVSKDEIDQDKLEIIKLASNQRRQKKMSVESMAAVTIQKMWRGRLTCDMEATKAALESERKIQQLQMQAINALWKKVSTLQAADTYKPDGDALRQLTETCCSLQTQVVELQGCMQQVLRCVSSRAAAPVATQTDIVAVNTPQ